MSSLLRGVRRLKRNVRPLLKSQAQLSTERWLWVGGSLFDGLE